MSFYRTYRPQYIEEIDNVAVRAELIRLLSKDKKELPHAYLLTGPKGTGKTTTARLIAKLFNCTNSSKDSGPCGKCDTCKSIANGSYLDVLEIDAASNRGIDEVRQLRERIGLSPSSGTYKVYIIDEVHMMTNEAFNALLKTLEEPPAHAIFVLATTDPHKVPITIQSRCMHISFRRATDQELVQVIERIAKKEKIDIEKEALSLIATHADGSFRDATKLLEQLSFVKGTITIEIAEKTLSISDVGIRSTFLAHLAAQNSKELLADIAYVVDEGRDIKNFMTDILQDLEKELVALALENKETAKLTKVISVFTKAFEELRYSPIPQLPLELAVIELCTGKKVELPVVEGKVAEPVHVSLGLLTIEKLTEHWPDFITAIKPYNHSLSGVLRSTRPKSVDGGIVTIEAFYTFHQEKLSEVKSKEMLSTILKTLFGEKVSVEIVLGKK